MLTLRKSQERGYADHGWLKSFHSFSFANYYDPAAHGLRQPARDQRGPHRRRAPASARTATSDMEIISYVLSGELAHKDSMGNVKGIPPGDVQRMSAGTRRACTASSTTRHGPDHAFPADLDRAERDRHPAQLRAEDLPGRAKSAARCAWSLRPTAPTAR